MASEIKKASRREMFTCRKSAMANTETMEAALTIGGARPQKAA